MIQGYPHSGNLWEIFAPDFANRPVDIRWPGGVCFQDTQNAQINHGTKYQGHWFGVVGNTKPGFPMGFSHGIFPWDFPMFPWDFLGDSACVNPVPKPIHWRCPIKAGTIRMIISSTVLMTPSCNQFTTRGQPGQSLAWGVWSLRSWTCILSEARWISQFWDMLRHAIHTNMTYLDEILVGGVSWDRPHVGFPILGRSPYQHGLKLKLKFSSPCENAVSVVCISVTVT